MPNPLSQETQEFVAGVSVLTGLQPSNRKCCTLNYSVYNNKSKQQKDYYFNTILDASEINAQSLKKKIITITTTPVSIFITRTGDGSKNKKNFQLLFGSFLRQTGQAVKKKKMQPSSL